MKALFSAQVVLAAVVAACGWTASAQIKPEDSRAVNTAALDEVPLAVDPHKYQIGAEDILFVKVWREPDFTFPVAVRPDGKITIPLLGEIDAAGTTPIELTGTLTGRLSQYLNNPNVSIFVTDVRSKKYYIDGEVNRPGSYPLVTNITILEALSHSGGFKDFANTKKIRILRAGKINYFNFKDVTTGKRLEQNITVQNGDHIIVP